MAKSNHPGSSGQAQSGGINHTFGGGKGGTKQSRTSTEGKKLGSGKLNNGLGYTVRSQGGQNSLVSKTFSVGTPPPLRGGAAKTTKIKIRRPERGGST